MPPASAEVRKATAQDPAYRPTYCVRRAMSWAAAWIVVPAGDRVDGIWHFNP